MSLAALLSSHKHKSMAKELQQELYSEALILHHVQ